MTSPPEPSTVHIKTSSDITIVADQWPGDGPAIVMAHGGGQTRHSWGRIAGVLAAAGHRVLSIDLRGHGNSSWSTSGDYLIDSFRDDAMRVIDWLDEPVAWVGASLGGSTGLAAVDAAPQRFWALVLVDITPAPAQAGIDRIMTFMVETAATGFGDLDEAADAVAAYSATSNTTQELIGTGQESAAGRRRALALALGSGVRQQRPVDDRTKDEEPDPHRGRPTFAFADHARARPTQRPRHRGRSSRLSRAGSSNDAFTSAVVEFFRELA